MNTVARDPYLDRARVYYHKHIQVGIIFRNWLFWDWMSGEYHAYPHTWDNSVIVFNDEESATFFKLRWS